MLANLIARLELEARAAADGLTGYALAIALVGLAGAHLVDLYAPLL